MDTFTMETFINEGYWMGILVIVLYVIETVLLVKTEVFSPSFSRVNEAKKRGHVIKAKCIKGGYYLTEKDGRRDEHPRGTYEYFVDGKRYEHRHVFSSMNSRRPPLTLELYYLDNPKKVFMEDKYSPKRILFHLIPWALPMLLYHFLYG